MKKLFASLLSCLIFFGIIFSAYSSQALAAKNLGSAFTEVSPIAKNAGFDTSTGKADLISQVGMVIEILLGLLGVIFMIYTFYAGWLWMSAGGDAKKVDNSVDIIKRAVIGMLIVLAAYAISAYVVGKLTAQTLNQ